MMNQGHPPGSESTPVETVYFAEGDVLFEENETSFHFFVIQDGDVEIYKDSPAGKVVLATVGAGHSVGEFAMLDRKPRSASARALTTLTAIKVSPEAYQVLLDELPDWAVAVMKALVDRLRRTNEIVRNARNSNKGVLGQAETEALELTEFIQSETQVSRIRMAEESVDQTDSNFDFSVYDVDPSKPAKPSRRS